MVAPEVTLLLEQVPEFAGRYLALVEDADEDPGAAVAFEELADFTASLLRLIDRADPVVRRVMACLEQVAAISAEAEDLVGSAFLDNLGPDDVRVLTRSMGPATHAILDQLELPPAALP